MDEPMSTQEQQLCQFLMELPAHHKYRYTPGAAIELRKSLFLCMTAGGKPDYLNYFFPSGTGAGAGQLLGTVKLRDAQGAVEGAEYTEAARGKACGHIFRQGEASYGCRTCSADETCCLCAKCFEATDHTGHTVRISISPGNSGCCDCGDPEAWKLPMFCTIHSVWEGEGPKGKDKEAAKPPEDLVASIRMTISRVFDYMCDVISCAPEQLRQAKSVESIQQDEKMSRLSPIYGGGDAAPGDDAEYAVLLWNDEKHTVHDVRDQVARACKVRLSEGLQRAYETDTVGRSILTYDKSIEKLLKVAEILEKIRVTVTIRSARDTFREQMCGTMIEWLADVSGCSVGSDHHILRTIVCQEMLRPWRRGSPAAHANVGKDGIDDEDLIEQDNGHDTFYEQQARLLQQAREAAQREAQGLDNSDDEDDDDDDMEDNTPSSGEMDAEDDDDDVMMVDARPDADDIPMDWRRDTALEEDEATMAGYPPPPPPPPAGGPAAPPRRNARERDLTPSDSDTAEPLIAPNVYAKASLDIPKTPGAAKDDKSPPPNPGRYWLGTPAGYTEQQNVPVAEDLFERVRLDWMILFDMRMWKQVRHDLRSLYLTTVVTIPEFKRILGLRFAGLYTTLAQLYLIGDREPDHSIINISLQMLTTPSITAEVVERGNFLTCLMAILYTFLTTRQVGHPWDVSSNAVLAFDQGSVTNRRMYHFFLDLKYVFGSPHVQERLRTEERYLLQFLDLVKLHQGICPNVRAIGEHVEYETDSWISASLITREINRLCRQFAESFRNVKEDDSQFVSRAIRLTAKAVILNSIGAERTRFCQAEIKDEVRFKTLTDFEFDTERRQYEVVKFVVEEQPISFHHALHYTLSWLIECGKSMSVEQLRALLSFTTPELLMKPKSMGRKHLPKKDFHPEDYLMAAFDYPLRVCAWLAQMKAGMWVRNGMSLRHQASTYRGVSQRDVSHHRDILLLQTALVVCDPGRVLVSIVDRFGMEKWIKGLFEQKSKAQDDNQHLDVIEDMIHLLIILLSDRTSLIRAEDEPNSHILTMKRDLTHVLCFKPLSFSEIGNKLPEKFQEQDEFQQVLSEIATFKPPEGVSDVGTFELKPQYIEEIDPYIAHYNKNQREESETAYRKWMAKKTGKPVEDVVYEPRLRPIPSGAFTSLSHFTGTGMFAQIVYYSLLYPLVFQKLTPTVPLTRVETYLHVVLHLIIIAVTEDKSDEQNESPSFISHALRSRARSNFMPNAPQAKTVVQLLEIMSTKEEFKTCHAKIGLILRRMRQKRSGTFDSAYLNMGLNVDRINTSSPANNSADEERERKKRAALDRQARVMAQFQEQQKNFMEKQGNIDWGDMDDLDEEEVSEPAEERKNYWKYPAGTCILCQEETDDRRLHGTFAFISESCIVRQTDLQDPDFVREAANTPSNLDRSAEDIRPFGIAHENRKLVEKVTAAGQTVASERQVIARGFPWSLARPGPVSVGCGHIMHYSCFETYFAATANRHKNQVARHHPENPDMLEFVCPLCKALGNAFLPIIWKGQDESYPGPLQTPASFAEFLYGQMRSPYYALGAARAPDQVQNSFARYTASELIGSLADRSSQLIEEAWEPGPGSLSGTPFNDTFSPVPTPEPRERPGSVQEGSGVNLMRELVRVYRRLRDTLIKNGLYTRHGLSASDELGNELCASDTLARAVGFSISAVEIQQRGVEAEYGLTFLEKIPEQGLTHLRILSNTVTSYVTVGGLRHAGSNRIESEYRRDCERQHCQLFMALYFGEETDHIRRPADIYPPLLSQDPFIFLCESIHGVGRAQDFEISHLVRLCYLAEIVKVVYHMGHNIPAAVWLDRFINLPDGLSPVLANFADFCLQLIKLDIQVNSGFPEPTEQPLDNKGFDQPGIGTLEGYYSFVRKYALVFLRKCLILLYVLEGVDFNSHVSPNPELDELDRLTEALRLPSFDEMCTALRDVGSEYGWPDAATTASLVTGWLKHQLVWPRNHGEQPLAKSALVAHPGIFELVGLPKNYDTLLEECTRRKCPTTGKDVSDPMICLHCGEVFCGQAICCLQDEKLGLKQFKIGGAQQHSRKCQRNVGLFLNIRKCCVYYLYRMSGSFSNAPYIDKWGEVDLGLRHGRQLFLSQRRYDSVLRNMWLSHGIPSFISRKLEADINNGGWETI